MVGHHLGSRNVLLGGVCRANSAQPGFTSCPFKPVRFLSKETVPCETIQRSRWHSGLARGTCLGRYFAGSVLSLFSRTYLMAQPRQRDFHFWCANFLLRGRGLKKITSREVFQSHRSHCHDSSFRGLSIQCILSYGGTPIAHRLNSVAQQCHLPKSPFSRPMRPSHLS